MMPNSQASRRHTTSGPAELRVAFRETSLAVVLIAQSRNGVAAILLGDHRAPLLRDLQNRFPTATLVDQESHPDAGADALLDAACAEIVRVMDSPSLPFRADLDMHGSEFQLEVWRALRDIPPGSTATYTDVANTIGRPRSVRAVARACGANPLAVVVPCHRVVARDGSLSGYRWGVERKRELLAREGAGQSAG